MGIIGKVINKFRVFTFMYWAMVLSMTGMYTMYIQQKGFSKEEISIVITIYTLCSLVGQIFIGYLVDKFKNVKRIMLASIVMGLVVGIGLNFATEHWHIYVLIFIWAFFISGTSSLSEAWTMHALSAYGEQRNFGRVRGFGSIGYALSGVLLGVLLQRYSWKVFSFYIIASVLITIIIMLTIKDNYKIKHAKKSEKVSFKEALNQIFRIKPLMVMVSIVFIYNFVLKGIYSYLALLISDFGGGALSLGFTYFFDAGPEIVTFFLASKLLKKFHSVTLVFAAFVLQIIRFSVILIFNNTIAVMIMGVFSGFAFGLLAASYKTYIYELAPDKYKASCLSLSESIIGVSGIISAPIFGIVFAKFGTVYAILFGLALEVISAIILFISIIKTNVRRKENVPISRGKDSAL